MPNNEKDIFAFSGYFSETRTKAPHINIESERGFPEIIAGILPAFVKNSSPPSLSASSQMIQRSMELQMDEQNGLFLRLQDSRYHQKHTRSAMKKEYERLGWIPNDSKKSPFRITTINENYQLCETYPEIAMLPIKCDDALLVRAAAHRSRKRFPAITWSNSFHVTIARSSQPQSGMQQKRY